MEGTKQAEEWLREAKARYGQALQRLHIARNKKQEFEKQARARQQAGNPLTTEEQQIFTSKVAQCNKAITESQTFMEKFKQQQNDFRNAISSQQYTKQPGQEGQPHPQSAPGMTLQPGMQAQQDGPQAHSISSAVSAAASARNRQQQDQTATQATVPAQSGSSGSPVNPNGAAAQPGVTPVKPDPNPNVFPTSTHPDAPNSAGPHRPASHAGMPQSALTQHPSSQSLHAHPLSASINGAKPVTAQAITKNLQVTEPKPVQMPPARPTLNGGASVGMAGSLGQPAITTLPGYVLESSEDGRMMSKKKLNELIREVVGLGKEGSEEESSMTTEAEEVRLLSRYKLDVLTRRRHFWPSLTNSSTTSLHPPANLPSSVVVLPLKLAIFRWCWNVSTTFAFPASALMRSAPLRESVPLLVGCRRWEPLELRS
jgi:hypothetical protein